MRALESHAEFRTPVRLKVKPRIRARKRFTRYLEQTWILYAAFYVVLRLLSVLPRSLSQWIGRTGGTLAFWVDRANVRRGLSNLAMAFPTQSDPERHATLRASYRHLGSCLADACRFSRTSSSEILNHWILRDAESDRVMQEALKEEKGVICVSAHAGFWELTGFIFPAMGYPSVCIANRLPADRINAEIQRIRGRLGNEIVEQEGALVAILRALRDRKTVGIIMDHWGKSRSPLVPFFGRPTRTIDTVARLHVKTGAPIVSALMIREANGKYRWRCKRIAIPSAVGRSHDQHVYDVLRVCNADIEDAIREHPEQWTWMHNRWRDPR